MKRKGERKIFCDQWKKEKEREKECVSGRKRERERYNLAVEIST